VAAGVGGAREVALLRREVTLAFAGAAAELLRDAGVTAAEVDALGCHGQTVWHEPPGPGTRHGAATPGTSLQLLDPALLAARTGVPVVSDFRSADLAAGGQGAPLVPWPDQVLFAAEGAARALLNVGGVANVTRVPPRESGEAPLAFDTGPGNALMDEAVRLATGGAGNRDTDGAMAAAGAVDPTLLARLLADPFFQLDPPRSTGRERFGAALVRELAGELGLSPGSDGWADLLATLAAFTVESAAAALERWVLPRGVVSVVVTGGGARNPVLVAGLRARLAPLPVETGAAALGGVDPDAREAAAFALLAWAYLEGVPGNVPGCTGASGPRVLGSWTPAHGRGS
jgi:anhydro-N-acetylmuramic acid kinase